MLKVSVIEIKVPGALALFMSSMDGAISQVVLGVPLRRVDWAKGLRKPAGN